MNKRKSIVLTNLFLLILSGCSSYKSKFDCGVIGGVGCTNMDRTYMLIKTGEIEKYDIDQKKQKKCKIGNCSTSYKGKL